MCETCHYNLVNHTSQVLVINSTNLFIYLKNKSTKINNQKLKAKIPLDSRIFAPLTVFPFILRATTPLIV